MTALPERDPNQEVAKVLEEIDRQRHDPRGQRLLKSELQQEVADYEKRYGRASSELQGAIERGELSETEDVCRWIILYDALRKIEEG